ncbi:FKBP-type peptidyl-prolyl cis-trans isomerase [Massilia sp. DWR3-1-1]|uniref:FKBP-type peptidyl-prolyl cis-trans isomerase n=1 Tax=Massilia sp. DWR3-1-1 TaxID=2804559 RepID=UPI003CE90A37
MNFKLPLIAAFVGALSLSACGGSSGTSTPAVAVSSPATLVSTDVTVGTGATVTTNASVTMNYTVWVYKADAVDFKGVQVDTRSGFVFTVGDSQIITGLNSGIIGMKVGGRRVLLIPAAQAYAEKGAGVIPPNSGIVFDMTVTGVK